MNTSEFAKLCKVSKRTLIHYDNIGLIKPYRVLENGYREYNMVQLQKMDTIKILQKAGYSLNEIKEIYMQDSAEIERQLQRAKEMLKRKIAEYQQMSRYIESKLKMYEQYKSYGNQPLKGQFEVAKSYVKLTDEDHFFSFLQDEFMEFSMIDSENQSFLQKGNSLRRVKGYGFFITIDYDVSSIIPQIQEKIREIGVKDPGEYHISIIPHALLEDSERAVIRVVIETGE